MISIDRIRVANLLIAERDYYENLYNNCEIIVSIKDVTINTQDTIANKLRVKIDNLNFIISSKDNILKLEESKLLALQQKHRKEKFLMMGGSAMFILLLILL